VFHKSENIVRRIPEKQSDLMGKPVKRFKFLLQAIKIRENRRAAGDIPPGFRAGRCFRIAHPREEGPDRFIQQGLLQQIFLKQDNQGSGAVFPQGPYVYAGGHYFRETFPAAVGVKGK
jgi:hypothetical protein